MLFPGNLYTVYHQENGASRKQYTGKKWCSEGKKLSGSGRLCILPSGEKKASARRRKVPAKTRKTGISPVRMGSRGSRSKCPRAPGTGENGENRNFAGTGGLPKGKKQVPGGGKYWRKPGKQEFRRYGRPAGEKKAGARRRKVPAKTGKTGISPVREARRREKSKCPPGSNSGCYFIQYSGIIP